MKELSYPGLISAAATLVLLTITGCVAEIKYGQYGSCCIDQDPPVISVEKLIVESRTKSVTHLQRVTRKCGTFGWDTCTSYTTVLIPKTYYVQLYTHRTKYPPCKAYGCCKGFQELLDKCIELDKLEQVIQMAADIRKENPDSDIKQALAKVLQENGILG